MPAQSKDKLEDLRLFISQMMNSEQDEHAKLISDIEMKIGGTDQFKNISDTLKKIYEAKIQTLEAIYRKIQELQ